MFEAVFPILSPFARIPVCGLISMYNATTVSPGPILLPHMMRAIFTKRLTFRGFIVSDFAARYEDFMRDVSAWVGEGRIKYREDVVEGLENAPRALIGLLRGENFGSFWCELCLPLYDPDAHRRERGGTLSSLQLAFFHSKERWATRAARPRQQSFLVRGIMPRLEMARD